MRHFKKLLSVMYFVGVLSNISGCSTVMTLIDQEAYSAGEGYRTASDDPLIYSGTRFNVSILYSIFTDNDGASHPHQLVPDWLVGTALTVDTPLSFVADTLVLPVTVPWAIYQQYRYPVYAHWSDTEIKRGQDKHNALHDDKKEFPITFVEIPKGCFWQGTEEPYFMEKSPEKVCVDAFMLAQFEITQGQWMDIMGSNPSINSACGLDCPVENISYRDALEFIEKYNQTHATTIRLPSELEWEYAAKVSALKTFEADATASEWMMPTPWEDDPFSTEDWDVMRDYAWFDLNSKGKTFPVGRKYPMEKLYDMVGNVAEMVEVEDPDFPSDYVVHKGGGSQYHYRTYRLASRHFFSVKTESSGNVGIRVAMDIPH